MASNKSIDNRRLLTPRQQSAAAKAEPRIHSLEPPRSSAVGAAADTVSVVVEATPLDGVTVAGEKLQVTPGGNPEQSNETAELNPFSGVIDRFVFVLCPATTVKDPDDTAVEKSGAGGTMT
jgi:hypothetical protein